VFACLAGKPEQVTSKDHNFFPGETVAKQIVVVNDGREPVTCESEWRLNLPQPLSGRKTIVIAPGGQERVTLRFVLPETLAPAAYRLEATFKPSNGKSQADHLVINVLSRPEPLKVDARLALFDPSGETRTVLEKLVVQTVTVVIGDSLTVYDILIIGKAALTAGNALPDLTPVRAGLKVILFEQTADALQTRLGFRVQEYGLRNVVARLPDHPVLDRITAESLRDWRGAATLLSPRLSYELQPRLGPTVLWSGLRVPHLWRCGNRGNVASVLIEKPACGDFLSILDGGYALQYSALLEHQEGRGLLLFCQADVSGRTESDPVAESLVHNLLAYAAEWQPHARREAIYAGEPAGKKYLEDAGLSVRNYEGEKIPLDKVLLLGPGAGNLLKQAASFIAEFLEAGGGVLAIGLDQHDADVVFPERIRMRRAEHINAFFEPPRFRSLLAGVAPADVHNRDPREVSLVEAGAEIAGDGVLATSNKLQLVFCQLAPWRFENNSGQMNLKRTKRRLDVMLTRLLANLGVEAAIPLLERFRKSVAGNPQNEQRWSKGFYLDQPEEWDDPYRFFRW
jgi:hypothetical protein